MTLKRFLPVDESGAIAVEYGLICVGIGLLILLALNVTGQQLVAMLTSLLNAFG